MIKSIIYFSIAIVSFIISSLLETILKRKYYTSEAYGWPVGKYFFIALLNPKKYFKKNDFQKAYVLYLLSIILLCVAISFLFVMWPLSLKG